ncbi:GNAT family N-acetyltransferase [Quadrisphaera oryzae]|uniref:GNAT family N-acetyltransferase n=1 Tax=Quadrisphaera TaxID=317661 RepID=UPI001644CD6F|nr:GNAT family N-acetyltransferase [Quadrisphaera sp. RL12-1S]
MEPKIPAPYVVQPLAPGQHDAAMDTVWRAFGWGQRRAAADEVIAARAIEIDRTLVAVDTTAEDGHVVGTTSTYSLTMTLPGGAQAPVAGVWMVSVDPTHRRRGVQSALLHHQLRQFAADGESISALWTTEAPLYQRFGYGLATWRSRIEVDLAHAVFTPRATALAASSGAQLRLMSLEQALPHLVGIHEKQATTRPGTLARDERRWQQLLGDDDGPAAELVVAIGPAGATGYAAYRLREGAPAAVPTGEVAVQEISALDAATHAQLWRFLLDTDLRRTLTCSSRPLPDPLAHLLSDHRRMDARVDDALWVRLVDLPTALSMRAYSRDVDVVVEVEDDLLPANAGRWRVTVADDGQRAQITRSDRAPDLSMDVSDLGAAHFGATTLADLARAGRVIELKTGALAAASAAWGWPTTPDAQEIF